MKLNSSALRFTVAAIIVTLLGGLAGWYLFINKQISATDAQDSARGFDASPTFGGAIGSGISNLVGSVIGDIVGSSGEESTVAPELWRITRTPVAGLGFAATTSKLYFAERASGNVLIADPSVSEIARLTNTLVPKVEEAHFAADGSVVLRSIDDSGTITTFAAKIATSTSPAAGDTPNKLEGVYLPEGILSLEARSNPNELFYILKENDGSSALSSAWLGTDQKRVLASALSDWQAMITSDGARYVAQNASDDVSGFVFKVTSSGALERVIGNLPGLTVLPRANSTAILYSTSGNGSVALFGRTGAQNTDVRLPIRTISEKCVWAPGQALIAYCAVPQTPPSGTFLRDRYDGSVHTADAWWRVDVSANSAEQIFAPELDIALDVESPRIDESGTHIAFINGADKTLWMLTIKKK